MKSESSAESSCKPLLLVIRAWAVHFYTALGLVVGLLSIIAITQGKAQESFLLSLVAFTIDGTDGVMARSFRVTYFAPEFDGRRLDDITDYINYVLVPCFFALQFKLIDPAHVLVLAAPILASGYGFCSTAAKTDDGYFTGFPSLWNVVVLYMYLLKTSTVVNEAVLLLLALLVFVPLKYLYPTKTQPLKWITLPYSCLWFVLVLLLVFRLEDPNPWVLYGSLTYVVYYFGVSFYLHLAGHHRAPPHVS